MIELIISFIFFAADRFLKYAITHSKQTYHFFSFFQYKGSYNTGLALSFFYNNKFVFYIVIIAFLLFLAWGITTLYHNRQNSGIYLIFFGGISNIIDRFWCGAVIDYIQITARTVVFPIFNIADIMIVIGITMMISSLFKQEKRRLSH